MPENSIQRTPNKEKAHLQDNAHSTDKKKQGTDLNEINTTKSIKKLLFININQNSVSIYPEENNTPSKNKSKDIISKLMMKTIGDKKFVEKIRYIKHKLYLNYGYPYKKIKYKLKDGETRPLTCDYYEINRILNKSKCRLLSKFHDYNLELNDMEYLIRYSSRKEYYIIMKYLLYFVYAYDRITYSKYCQRHYDLNEIKSRYDDLLPNNKNLKGSSDETIGNNSKKIKIMNKRESIFNFNFDKFKANMELKNNKIYISSNSNKNIKKRCTIDFSGINQKENNLNSRNSTLLNNYKKQKEVNNNINDFYVGLGNINNTNLISCKCTKPINLFIEKMSFKLIPNCTPNLFPSPNKILKILDKFLNNFKKLKLNLYQSENTIKSKRNWYSDDEMDNNQFIKDISFSSENFYSHDDNLEEIIKTNHFHCHNENRRMKYDDDIKDVENLIINIDESPKKAKANILNNSKKNIISKNDVKNESDDKSSNQNKKGSKKNTFKINGLKKNNNDEKSNGDRNQSSFSSFKSNNYISSLTSSKIIDNINESKNKVNKRNEESIKINNNSLKLFKSNLEKDIKYCELSNKYLNEKLKIKENKRFQTLKNYHSQDIKDSHYIYYNTNSNSMFNSTKSLYKKGFKNNNFNKKYRISSTRPNKIKLKKDINKDFEYFPYFTDNNKKSIFSDSTKHLKIKDGKEINFYNDSLPHNGKYKFKQIYEFAYGKYQERNEIEYKMNLLREITTEYQKNLYLSKNKLKNRYEKDYFPSFDFLLNFMMKKKIKKGINQDIYKNTNFNKMKD